MSTKQSSSTSLSLKEWAQSRLNSLYQVPPSSGESDTDAAGVHFPLESVFSSNAQIFANNEPVSLDDFKKEITHTFGSVKSSVEWKEFMEIPSDAHQQTGIVAGFLVVTRTLKFRIRAAPAQNYTYITLSAKIERDPAAAADESEDTRRVVHLFHTSLSKAAPVHLAKPTAD